jgi:hypothetical protein
MYTADPALKIMNEYTQNLSYIPSLGSCCSPDLSTSGCNEGHISSRCASIHHTLHLPPNSLETDTLLPEKPFLHRSKVKGERSIILWWWVVMAAKSSGSERFSRFGDKRKLVRKCLLRVSGGLN